MIPLSNRTIARITIKVTPYFFYYYCGKTIGNIAFLLLFLLFLVAMIFSSIQQFCFVHLIVIFGHKVFLVGFYIIIRVRVKGLGNFIW